jgi:3,4-dihydroxy 2-butanone 4-phosphate synthase / GTP cyclohydrolase II
MSFSPISDIIQDFKNGKFVILTDDENRENEGDLMIAAEFVKSEHINFMSRQACGLICLVLSEKQVEKLKLPMMTSLHHQSGVTQTAFTVSIEASQGISSGISARDRAHTVLTAINVNAKSVDVICPGHIFPLKANSNGVLARAGHTEASHDLSKLSGLNPAAVICEIMNEDGTMSRVADLFQFAKKHQIKIGTIASLIEYRKQNG